MWHALGVIALLVGAVGAYPPPKAGDKPDYDKLAKEAVENMLKAMAEGKTDEAIKLMGFPFRDTHGEEKSTQEMATQLDRESGAIGRVKVTTAGVATAETLAGWAKKENVELQATKDLEALVKHAGKDVRFVVVKFEVNATTFIHSVFLVKPEKGGVKIVGAGR
jgi:hypothetical protein